MARIIGDFQEVILTDAMPMLSNEFFYEASSEACKEVYEAVGEHIDRQVQDGITFTEFDLVLGLTGGRTVRYKCDVAFDPLIEKV